MTKQPRPDQLITKRIMQFTRKARHGYKVARRVRNKLDEHFAAPLRRDGRGRKSQELRRALVTLRHLINATAWRSRVDLDVNVRQEAKALVTTACHGQVSFESLMDRARTLRGRVNKCGKARNARRAIKGCKPLRIELPEGFTVERLHTVKMLAHAGRTLGNCTKNNNFGDHDELRTRESDFYWVRHGNSAVAMLRVHLRSREIAEFLGKDNEDVELPRSVLITMLSRLRLNGDDVEACLQQGAASIFVTGGADICKPNYRRRRRKLRLWWNKGVLVIREGRRHKWSSFCWDGTAWQSSDASRRHRLDDLMTVHPLIACFAHKAAQPQTDRPGRRLR